MHCGESMLYVNLIKISSLELNLRSGLPASMVPVILRGQ